jgi:protein tyrosine/serine phosphatase
LLQQLHLLLWGVSREDVIEDYMKTNAFTEDRIEEILGQIELMSFIPDRY